MIEKIDIDAIAIFLLLASDIDKLADMLIDDYTSQWKIKKAGQDRFVLICTDGQAMRVLLDRYEIQYI